MVIGSHTLQGLLLSKVGIEFKTNRLGFKAETMLPNVLQIVCYLVLKIVCQLNLKMFIETRTVA